ncbi:amino acid ABC transporter substrate-binding protein [Actinobaculum suis]|uniref:Amino acid ABC transporter substrate-binding protein n=1 Tax=Actinobaculum suis TaxID=1657 RepID=A0A1B9BAH8_9ACTO|nr:transporter substrate-binding domain-containing protein [Actinobaculum suis]OCA93101.1 hypothetical protein ACU21_01225 [Actinobaculum suis]OCA93532.1 hypothetical protein ACU20_01710 [Actinobaculum suis]VDG75848.1 amino acid ABC transporter substrate-binding protein [Actinobaculum suis]
MRKHFLAGGLALAAAFFPLTGCSQQAGSGAGASDSGTNATSSEASPAGLTVREGELRIGLDGNFAPFGFHDENGELVGFEKEIGDVIAQDLGLQAVFIESPWDSLIAGLDTNNYDVVINNLVPTAERNKTRLLAQTKTGSLPQTKIGAES